MITRFFRWAGTPGVVLAGFLIVTLSLSIATVALSGWAAVPFFNLFVLLLLPFPTLALYAAAALLVFALLRRTVGALRPNRPAAQWVAAGLALAIAAGAGFGGAEALNRAAGLTAPSGQTMPPAVALRRGDEIALIEEGEPPYVRCGALCLSLLAQGQASAVEVAASVSEPAALQRLPGKRFSLTPQTRACLAKQRAYNLKNDSDLEKRRDEFIRFGSLPIEYDTCLDVRDATVSPAQQITLVQWKGKAVANPRGCPAELAVIRTVVPGAGRAPEVREARFRAGYRYFKPLAIEPFFGTADCFLPSVARTHFQEAGFPDTLAPNLWGLLQGSEGWGRGASAWLDTVVKPAA